MSMPDPKFYKIPRPLNIENLLAEVEEPKPLPFWIRCLPYAVGLGGILAWDAVGIENAWPLLLIAWWGFRSIARDREKKRNAALVKLLREMVDLDRDQDDQLRSYESQ
ncbi:MAG: hypothetical protein QM755_01905 [Luteolibacter sp.]